jgi:folate-binding protein YgfZ
MPDQVQDLPLDAIFAFPNRSILRLSGPDRAQFLQGLVSNDVTAVQPGRPVYACLLTPQGKFLHDFFLIADDDSLLIDCEADRRADLLSRLKMYKLRSKIELTDVTDEYTVYGGIGMPDPRLPALGRRLVAPKGDTLAVVTSFDAYDRLRIGLAVPDGSRDMEIGKAILLENNIDLLNGVSWTKGCYTGQELTARTHYRGLIKKRLCPVRIDGVTPAAGTPLIENGIEVGEMRSSNGDLGLALLKTDNIRDARLITIEGATLTPEPPAFLSEII